MFLSNVIIGTHWRIYWGTFIITLYWLTVMQNHRRLTLFRGCSYEKKLSRLGGKIISTRSRHNANHHQQKSSIQMTRKFPHLTKILLKGHPLSTYAKFSEKVTSLTPLIHTRRRAYQEVRNVSFSENLAYILNGWPPRRCSYDNSFPVVCLINLEKRYFPRIHIRNVSPPGRDVFWRAVRRENFTRSQY